MTLTKSDALAHANLAERGAFKSIAAILRALVNGDLMSRLEQGAGEGVSSGAGTVYRSSVRKDGGIIKTEIIVDLTGLNSSSAGDIIGVDSTLAPCHIGRVTTARNGAIFAGRVTCLEAPSGGDADIDVYAADEGTGVEDEAVSTLVETQLVDAGSHSLGSVDVFSAVPGNGQYIYLVGAGGSAGTYTAGKLLIELWGYDVSDPVA